MRSNVSQYPETVIDRPPIAGWLIGIMLGLGFSYMPCRWIDHATYNSRALLPAVEAMAAGDPEMAIMRLKEVEARAVFDRLFERPKLREGMESLMTAIPHRISTKPATVSGVR